MNEMSEQQEAIIKLSLMSIINASTANVSRFMTISLIPQTTMCAMVVLLKALI
jgi:hypothetical protein